MKVRHSYSRQGKKIAEINVVPYIDVMLVLLVIFMVTIPIIQQTVKVEVPNADSRLTDEIKTIPIILTINDKKRLFLNIYPDGTKALTPKQVIYTVIAYLQLAQTKGKKPLIMVKGDKNVDYQSVLTAILLLKKAGADNIGLITQPYEHTV